MFHNAGLLNWCYQRYSKQLAQSTPKVVVFTHHRLGKIGLGLCGSAMNFIPSSAGHINLISTTYF
jgi:hypothetical protein